MDNNLKHVTARLTPNLYAVTPEGAAWLNRAFRGLENRTWSFIRHNLRRAAAGTVPAQSSRGAVRVTYRGRMDDRDANRLRPEQRGFLRTRGWSITDGTAHRGILHPDEFVGPQVVDALLNRLGVSYEEFRSMYGNPRGRPPTRLAHSRRRTDAILSACENLAELARIMNVPERNLQRAAARGRAMRRPIIDARRN